MPPGECILGKVGYAVENGSADIRDMSINRPYEYADQTGMNWADWHNTFDVNAVRIFSDGVRLGGISNCQPLDEIKFDRCLDTTIDQVRDQVGLETGLLAAYYTIEKQRYPDARASQRLLD